MNLCFCYLSKGLYLESPQEPPHTNSYRRSHMLPVSWRMSGIHRILASPRACVLCRRRHRVTLVQLWRREDPLTSPTHTVTAIQCTKYMTSTPWQVELLVVSKSLWYHQGMYLKQKRQYKMCHSPIHFSQRGVIKPCHMKNWVSGVRYVSNKQERQSQKQHKDSLAQL